MTQWSHKGLVLFQGDWIFASRVQSTDSQREAVWREGIMNVESEGETSDEACLADTFITELLPQELWERIVLSSATLLYICYGLPSKWVQIPVLGYIDTRYKRAHPPPIELHVVEWIIRGGKLPVTPGKEGESKTVIRKKSQLFVCVGGRERQRQRNGDRKTEHRENVYTYKEWVQRTLVVRV